MNEWGDATRNHQSSLDFQLQNPKLSIRRRNYQVILNPTGDVSTAPFSPFMYVSYDAISMHIKCK